MEENGVCERDAFTLTHLDPNQVIIQSSIQLVQRSLKIHTFLSLLMDSWQKEVCFYQARKFGITEDNEEGVTKIPVLLHMHITLCL